MLDISATEIRENIKNGKTIRYLVPEKVREEIEQNSYYK
jgi:nicotinate-nucleotide adenylyltransferase